MDQILKSISVETLLNEITNCKNELDVCRLKTLSGYELKDADSITKEIVLKAIGFQEYLIRNQSTKASGQLMSKDTWEGKYWKSLSYFI